MRNAAFVFAQCLVDAAHNLKDAKDNEAPDDVSEILAEMIVALLFNVEARAQLDALKDRAQKKGTPLDQASGKRVDDLGDTADLAEKDDESTLRAHAK